ncbi:unnamed protein product [Effrenium voratum]|uniref:Uncharacterized protein n=1 Tax=Effrenium voratum TaxID=2562239 RepID=A0AA36MWT8_9DINO|nr:unnamed protein product [Effrenium voratum]CAJ1449797.1 unnamed protein product [Effrenium voratum]
MRHCPQSPDKGPSISMCKAQSETQRRTFREQRRASAKGMGALQQQLESRIQRLQRHTEELRGELQPGCANCSASFAAPDTLFCHRCGQKRVPTPERQSAHLSDESRSFDGRRLEHTLLGVA